MKTGMKIGVLGAGQLGRMLALAGYPLDVDFVFLDPASEACAAPLGEHIHADYSDEAALAELCSRVDLATFEFENVPNAAAEFVAARVPLHVAWRTRPARTNQKPFCALCACRLFSPPSFNTCTGAPPSFPLRWSTASMKPSYWS